MSRLLFCTFVVIAAAGAQAQVIYSTSFESPFTPGAISGQQGWTGGANYLVTNALAKTGSQSVVWRGTGLGYAWTALTPYTDTVKPIRGKVSIFIDPATATNQRAFGLRIWGGAGGGTGHAGVTINSDGRIRGGASASNLWGGTGIGMVANPVGRWIDVFVQYLPGATSALVSVDNVGYTFTVPALTSVADIDFYSEWDSQNVSSVGYFDDYSVSAVPEPGTMAALGLGALALLRRRRKA